MTRTSYLLLSLVVLSLFNSCKSKTAFELISTSQSGIEFNNTINNSDSLNVLEVENIYNGGGVGTGDFNNDGLPDLYFAGNMVSNKLYLNQGDFRFKDVTDQAKVNGDGRWGRGVSIVDINNDSLPDIYVSASLSSDSRKRENLLYVNQGVNKEGIPVFKNLAREYGLADTCHSTMAAFFDYDNDGDLDMYLVVNEIVKHESPNSFRPQLIGGEHPNTDKLFRNDWDSSMQHGVFKNVSREAGVTIEGFGHGVNIVDINRDGWKDVYVTNDFLSQNLLYINQKNGTFKNEVKSYFKHTAENAMGQDIIDINNDGLADVIELDMNPEDNSRKKMMMNPIGYQRYTNNDYFQYQYQYVRNVLQINQGPAVLENDSVSHPVFTDASFFAGIAETDWSWSPMVADYDNDGLRDIVITNGFPRDVTDHDFMAFRNKASNLASKKEIFEQIPEVKIANYAYKNNGDLTFTNTTKEWGVEQASFSNGGIYVDLDNDGDLDLVMNNINDAAFIYKNNFREINKSASNFVKVKLAGSMSNRDGLGAWIEIYTSGGLTQVYENTPYRGYLSSVSNTAHFGVGSASVIDSLVVKWPTGKMQVLKSVPVNRTAVVHEREATLPYTLPDTRKAASSVFTNITGKTGISYKHQDQDFVDFNIQNLLPHKLSEYGPALAVADIDGNGLDDMITGGSYFFHAQAFIQQQDGTFISRTIGAKPDATPSAQAAATGGTGGRTATGTAVGNAAGEAAANAAVAAGTNGAGAAGTNAAGAAGTAQPVSGKAAEDMGVLLFDADGDHDADLYIARGGYEGAANSDSYRDVFYVNDGKGNFTENTSAFPKNLISKSCARAADFDRDGDLDLFVAGRVEPGKYPVAVSSILYRNDTQNGSIRFTDITTKAAPGLTDIGLVCDALFSDFDNDGWQDLILMGEWMRVVFLKNSNGTFQDVSDNSGIGSIYGWWNSVSPGDFDNDGDMDYIVGNFGTNSLYRPTSQYPVNIIAKDFDKNGSFDALTSYFIPQSFADPEKREVPVHLRDDMIKQIVKTRARFQTYKAYSEATMKNLLAPEQSDSALKLRVTDLHSYLLQNDGKGKFTSRLLPSAAQLSVINGMVIDDFDQDGNLDLIASGNDFGTELTMGRYDASDGLFLKGDGKGGFKSLTILESGIYLPGNMKALARLRSGQSYLVAATENRGPLRMFKLRQAVQHSAVLPSDISAVVTLKNGSKRKVDLNYGSSFLSQGSRFLLLDNNVRDVEITNSKGVVRKAMAGKN